ncbi:MAG TPA: hypothetical protein VJA25_11375 [Dehalococcoidia bacterium]|nr:hypothetical protein [Dehalococcoidia bacterium]
MARQALSLVQKRSGRRIPDGFLETTLPEASASSDRIRQSGVPCVVLRPLADADPRPLADGTSAAPY